MATLEDFLRFEKYIKYTDSCWLWTGWNSKGNSRSGYGVFVMHGKQVRAHRMAWFFANWEFPFGDLILCHRCDIPRCVRPDHLFLGTDRDNFLDAISKGRVHKFQKDSSIGVKNGRAKLTEQLVREIKLKTSNHRGYKEIAASYGVSESTVQFIANGKTWRHVH